MVLKSLFASVIVATFFALGHQAVAEDRPADQYQPGQFLGLDLSHALLSPKLLGPITQFQPFPVEASTEPESAPATAAPKNASRIVIPKTQAELDVAQAHSEKLRIEKPHRPALKRLAAKKPAASHGNPLDAQARDTRIQVWPCKSGGICNWQR